MCFSYYIYFAVLSFGNAVEGKLCTLLKEIPRKSLCVSRWPELLTISTTQKMHHHPYVRSSIKFKIKKSSRVLISRTSQCYRKKPDIDLFPPHLCFTVDNRQPLYWSLLLVLRKKWFLNIVELISFGSFICAYFHGIIVKRKIISQTLQSA